MLVVNGVLGSVVDDSYTNKNSGELVPQTTLVFFPSDGETETTKVSLDKHQLGSGAGAAWKELIGKKVSAAVRIFDFKNGGYKILASGNGLPLTNRPA